MAHYRLCMKNGKALNAIANFKYNFGKEKYDYKKDEVIEEIHNMPKWAETPLEFWKTYAIEDRANSSYKKIELSLQDELSKEENLKMLKEFIENNIGKSYYWSVAIHDKESNSKGIKNIHAHIMICKRLEDGFERNGETFFRRYNSNSREKSGAIVDNEYWTSKQTLLNMREDWEKIINKYFEKNKIDKKVSSKSLSKQREKALKENDLLKAKSLDRPPVEIDGYILKKYQKKKNSLNDFEKEKIKEYGRTKTYKNLSELIYKLEKEEQKFLKLREEEKEKITKLQKGEKTFGKIFYYIKNLYEISIEKNILKEKINDEILLKKDAMRRMSKEYGLLELQLDNLQKEKKINYDEIERLETELEKLEDDLEKKNTNKDDYKKELLERIKIASEKIEKWAENEERTFDELKKIISSVQVDKLDEKINEIKKEIQFDINNLEKEEKNLQAQTNEKLKETLNSDNIEDYYKEYQYNNWEKNYIDLKESRRNVNKLEKKIKEFEVKLSEENLNVATYNSFSKNQYAKDIEEIKVIEERIEKHELKEKILSDIELETLNKRKDSLKNRIAKILNEFKPKNGKNKFIRRKYSIQKKYYENYIKLKNDIEKEKIKISYLENIMSTISRDKMDDYKEKYNKDWIDRDNNSYKVKIEELKLKKLELIKEYSETGIELKTFNIISKGEYSKLLTEYKRLNEEKENSTDKDIQKIINLKLAELEKKKEEIWNTTKGNMFYIFRNKVIEIYNKNMNNINKSIEKLEERIAKNESFKYEENHFRGSLKNLVNYNNFIQGDLGKALYTGHININIESSEDVWAKRLRKEMDFSR